MPASERSTDRAVRQARRAMRDLGEEHRVARVSAGLTQRDAGKAVGLSHAAVGRFERGELDDIGVVRASRMLAVVGRELSVRAYERGSPLRDRAHLILLERLRLCLHESFIWRTEVPFPNPGDPRTWDAIARLSRIRIGVEAETRPRDAQELERRLGLKRRDGGADRLILLLSDTRSNRAFLRECGAAFLASFAVSQRDALEALRAGRDPGGDVILKL